MGKVWSLENKFATMLEVEVAVAQVQAQMGMIPRKAARDIKSLGTFNVDRIQEIEKTTKHDVIAFVSNVAENVGDSGKYIHYGMTSSDVLDTALSLQINQAAQLIFESLDDLEKILKQVIFFDRYMQIHSYVVEQVYSYYRCLIQTQSDLL